MDEIGGVLFIGMFVIGLLFAAAILLFIASANLIVLVDQLFGSWPFDIPALSWGFNGFVLGALLFFACERAHTLAWREARQTALTGAALWLLILIVAAAN